MKKFCLFLLVAVMAGVSFAEIDQATLEGNRYIAQTQRQLDEARAAGKTALAANLVEQRDSAIVKNHILRYLNAPCPADFNTLFEDSKVYLKRVEQKDFRRFVDAYEPMLALYPNFTDEIYNIVTSGVITESLNSGRLLRASEAENLRSALRSTSYYKYYLTRNKNDAVSIPYLDKTIDRTFKLIDDLDLRITSSNAATYAAERQTIINLIIQYTRNGNTFTINGVSFEMVPVEGGTFNMGATREQENAHDNEKPVHQVTLSSYMIGKTEVTQVLWQAVMGNNPSYSKGDDLPVENVSWNDCQRFINKLNTITGEHFRLPTEAEWEFAARGGNKSRRTQYSGSANLDEVAWYRINSGSGTHPVATKAPNELGVHDMSGNVWEWCQDWYWYGEYPSGNVTNPTGPSSATRRVFRGGGWILRARCCRVAYRNGGDPGSGSYDLGFRLAR